MVVSHGYRPTCSTVYMLTIGHEVELLVVQVRVKSVGVFGGDVLLKSKPEETR